LRVNLLAKRDRWFAEHERADVLGQQLIRTVCPTFTSIAVLRADAECGRAASDFRSGDCGARHQNYLGHFTEVLSCGSEVELVFCSIGTAQAQVVQFQDELEVSEQHFDLLSFAA
jgi:hypothetical protein